MVSLENTCKMFLEHEWKKGTHARVFFAGTGGVTVANVDRFHLVWFSMHSLVTSLGFMFFVSIGGLNVFHRANPP